MKNTMKYGYLVLGPLLLTVAGCGDKGTSPGTSATARPGGPIHLTSAGNNNTVSFSGGSIVINGTTYDVPSAGGASTTVDNGSVLVRAGGHTLRNSHGHLSVDGKGYGSVPADADIRLVPGGGVSVNGAQRHPE